MWHIYSYLLKELYQAILGHLVVLMDQEIKSEKDKRGTLPEACPSGIHMVPGRCQAFHIAN